MDLAYEISKLATKVTLSHHHKTDPLTKFPANVNLKPDVVALTETGADFADGTHQDYSVIFYCTGIDCIYYYFSDFCFIYFLNFRLQIYISILEC